MGNYLSGEDPAMSKIGKNLGNAGRVVPEWSEVQAADRTIYLDVGFDVSVKELASLINGDCK